MYKYVLDLIRLFYFDADSDTIDARLDQDFLILIAGDGQGVEEDFWRAGGFDFRDIMAFRCLGCEVGKGKCSSQG